MKTLAIRWFAAAAHILIIAACTKDNIETMHDNNNNLNNNNANNNSNNNNNNTSNAFTADSLRMNEIQVIGSHNSYRLKTYDPIFNFVQSFSSLLPSSLDPDGWDYTHLPLEEQFSDYGIRQIELDLYYDPSGGRFYNRQGNTLVGEPVASQIPELNAPGFKLIHVADVDYMTNYISFKDALEAVRNWSLAHPRHLPIFILVETKETSLAGSVPVGTWTEALPFDAAAMDAIDEEIKDVFGATLDGVITPDDVRGNFATLNEAVTTRGWPHIGSSRGKVVFLLNNRGAVAGYYLQGRPSLEGRIMFTNARAGDTDAAFIMANDPSDSRIGQWVSNGYIIRTRADDNTDEARTGDVSDRDQAFESGAQLISTDYYRPDPRHLTHPSEWSDYSVRFANNEVARLNPVNGPAKFTGGPIE